MDLYGMPPLYPSDAFVYLVLPETAYRMANLIDVSDLVKPKWQCGFNSGLEVYDALGTAFIHSFEQDTNTMWALRDITRERGVFFVIWFAYNIYIHYEIKLNNICFPDNSSFDVVGK